MRLYRIVSEQLRTSQYAPVRPLAERLPKHHSTRSFCVEHIRMCPFITISIAGIPSREILHFLKQSVSIPHDRKVIDMSIGSAKDTDTVVRPLAEGDDFSVVARCIYYSDDYIYPEWFGSEEVGVRVLAEMIRRPTIYRRENVSVALHDGAIVGVLVSCESPVTMTERDVEAAFAAAGVPCDARTHRIFEEYYEEMRGERTGYYVANLYVDESYRRHGVGAALLDSVVRDKPLCFLECVKENAGAVRLYLQFGFKIEKEYMGACSVPCYKMLRKQ